MDYKSILHYPFKVARGERSFAQALNYMKYKRSLKNLSPIVSHSPVTINIFPTDKCNLKCDFCLTRSPKFDNKEFKHYPCEDMDFEMFKRVLDKFDKAFDVQIAGTGEPTLNKDIFKMIAYCKEKKMESSMNTNATIIDDKIEQLVCSGLTDLCISLNAHNADEFNRFTGEDGKYFYKICDNIKALVEKRQQMRTDIRFIATIILDKINYKYINEMIQVAGQLGVDKLVLYTIFPVAEDVNEEFSGDKRCLFDDDQEVTDFLSHEVKYPDSGLQVEILPLLKRNFTLRGCRGFFKIIVIDGNGNIGGCGKQILDLRDHGKFTDDDVWNNRYFQSMRQMFIDNTVPLLDTCKFCLGQFDQW